MSTLNTTNLELVTILHVKIRLIWIFQKLQSNTTTAAAAAAAAAATTAAAAAAV